jgi:predicted transcriptional regulator
VDGACQIILACDVTDAANDTQQAVPVAHATLTTLAQAGIALPQDEAGKAHAIPATLDNGS